VIIEIIISDSRRKIKVNYAVNFVAAGTRCRILRRFAPGIIYRSKAAALEHHYDQQTPGHFVSGVLVSLKNHQFALYKTAPS
jgi:hypothetical protein